MRVAALLGALFLLALARFSGADRPWNAWYWSEFDPDAGRASDRAAVAARRRVLLLLPTAATRRCPHAATAAEPTTFVKTDDYVIARNLW